MTIQTKQHGNIPVVSVSGRLDGVTAPEYEKTVRELIAGG
jgi:anti-anti-sigma regulatory factor